MSITTGQILAFLRLGDADQEIFAVQLLPHRFPEILEPDDALIASSYTLPDSALQDIPAALEATD